MSTKQVKGVIVPRHDTAENWAKATTFIPRKGELIIYEADTTTYSKTVTIDGISYPVESHNRVRFKVGDGTLVNNVMTGTNVNALPFVYMDEISGLTDKVDANESDIANIAEVVETLHSDLGQLSDKVEEIPGGTTPDGGDVFGDCDNNLAQSEFATAMGSYSIAGAKVFEVVQQSGATIMQPFQTDALPGFDVIRVQLNDPAATTLTMGDVCGVYYGDENDGHWQMIGLVMQVDGNMGAIVLVNYAPLQEGSTYLMPTYFLACGNPNPPSQLAALGVQAQEFAPRLGNKSIGSTSVAMGDRSFTVGKASYAQGSSAAAVGHYSFAQGRYAQALGKSSHAQGLNTIAWGECSTALGIDTSAFGRGAFSHGIQTVAGVAGDSTVDNPAYAEGIGTKATGYAAHAQGESTIASGSRSHAQGINTKAIGEGSTAEGLGTEAEGLYSHALGQYSKAIGQSSFAAGDSAIAYKYGSFACGLHTKTDADGQFVCGRLNESLDNALFIVGNGDSESDLNAFWVDVDNKAYIRNYDLTSNTAVVNTRGLKDYTATNCVSPSQMTTALDNRIFAGTQAELDAKFGGNPPEGLIWIEII